MKKAILFIVIFIVFNKAHAQEVKICGEIDYVQTTHFSIDFSKNFTLKFDNNNSIYKEINIVKEKENFEQVDSDDGQQLNFVIPRKNLNPELYYNNRKSFYFKEIFIDQELLVIEDSLVWNWNLKDDIKKIGAFNCQKATIEFRGREYTAWFTEEIPVPFGPWKFQGTSGLILEIYDNDRVFHIVAKKVKIEKKSECEIQIDKSKFKSALTINQYLKKKVELIKEDFAKLSSRLPKGYGALKYDENCKDCREEVEKFNE